MNTWIQLGYVPSPAQVSGEEGIDFLWSKGEVSPLQFAIPVSYYFSFELLYEYDDTAIW